MTLSQSELIRNLEARAQTARRPDAVHRKHRKSRRIRSGVAIDPRTWHRLLEEGSRGIIALAASIDPHDPAGVARLRAIADAELAHAALELAAARRRATAKWGPEVAARLVADPTGVEMASSRLSSAYKAARFKNAGLEHILDLCCGIGGDTMALQSGGLRVTGIDADPCRAWMCAMNAGCQTLVCDVSRAVELASAPGFHLDPARRDESGRSQRRLFELADHLPPPSAWRAIIERTRASAAGPGAQAGNWGGAIKLGPGVSLPALAAELGNEAFTLEFISESGRLTQAVCWLGCLAESECRTRATLLCEGHAPVTLAGRGPDTQPAPAPAAEGSRALRYLIEADASVERAGLLGELGAAHDWKELHPGLGLLTGDSVAPAQDPLAAFTTAFEVLEQDVWNQRRFAQRLRALGAGIVEVKTRGGACDPPPEELQRQLRGEDPRGRALTLFVLRLGDRRSGRRVGLICKRG